MLKSKRHMLIYSTNFVQSKQDNLHINPNGFEQTLLKIVIKVFGKITSIGRKLIVIWISATVWSCFISTETSRLELVKAMVAQEKTRKPLSKAGVR